MSELTTTFDNESFIDSRLNVNENITSILNNEENMENDLDAVNQIASELNSDSSMKSILDEPFVHRYDGEETDNIDVFVDNENYKIFASLKQIRFATLNDFPDVGSDRLIYIADDTKILYGWGTDGYFPLSAGGSNDIDLSNYYTKTQTNNLLDKKADKSEIPDVSGFITKSVSDLVNYYTKSQTYTQEEINARISAIPKFDIKVVSSLPTINISSTTIYLLTTGEESQNLYEEYIYVNNNWEKLGTQTVDLSEYVTETELQEKGYISELPSNVPLTDVQNEFTKTQIVSGGLNFGDNGFYVTGQLTKSDANTGYIGVKGYLIQTNDEEKSVVIGNSVLSKIEIPNIVQAQGLTDGTKTKTITEILSVEGYDDTELSESVNEIKKEYLKNAWIETNQDSSIKHFVVQKQDNSELGFFLSTVTIRRWTD